jgi:hypothetical protein
VQTEDQRFVIAINSKKNRFCRKEANSARTSRVAGAGVGVMLTSEIRLKKEDDGLLAEDIGTSGKMK